MLIEKTLKLLMTALAVLAISLLAAVAALKLGPLIKLGKGPLIQRERTPITTDLIIDRLTAAQKLITLTVECGPWEERLRQDTQIRLWPDSTEVVSALVRGDVTYGIDLKELRPGDVLISGGGQRVTIRLPAVKKLGFRVRLAKSRIIDHKGSWYWRKDSSLREAVLKQAEERLAGLERPSAKRLAREHAMDVIKKIIRQASSSDVAVRFEEAAESPTPD